MGRETLFCKTECGLRSADWATTRLPDRAGRKGPSSHLHPQRRHPGPADGTASLGLPEQGRNLEHPPDTRRGHPADHGLHPVRGLRRAVADGCPHGARRVRTRPVGCGPQGRSPVHRRGPSEWWQGLPLLPGRASTECRTKCSSLANTSFTPSAEAAPWSAETPVRWSSASFSRCARGDWELQPGGGGVPGGGIRGTVAAEEGVLWGEERGRGGVSSRLTRTIEQPRRMSSGEQATNPSPVPEPARPVGTKCRAARLARRSG